MSNRAYAIVLRQAVPFLTHEHFTNNAIAVLVKCDAPYLIRRAG
jgi:hypothetical protein